MNISEDAFTAALAKAWDEGYDEAEHEPIYNHEPQNPYRQMAENA